MIVLGIETSCDETAVAIVNDNKKIMANCLISQIDIHQQYGGVVPEIAARSHLEHIELLINNALSEAELSFIDIDAFAATCGPGLIGGLMVGATVVKTISMIYKKKFLAINHLAAHALLPRLTNGASFPYLLLLVSGGHCQTVIVNSAMDFHILGTTMDDAVGECFDKCAKMLKLPYPGGPQIEKHALKGDYKRFNFPIPLKGRKDVLLDFSFSGLKSSVYRKIEKLGNLSQQDKYDICASLQHTIGQFLANRLKNALDSYHDLAKLKAVVISGGVAANQKLNSVLAEVSKQFGLPFIAPPLELCTDNGVMVAWAGLEKLSLGITDCIDFKMKPRWSLEDLN